MAKHELPSNENWVKQEQPGMPKQSPESWFRENKGKRARVKTLGGYLFGTVVELRQSYVILDKLEGGQIGPVRINEIELLIEE